MSHYCRYHVLEQATWHCSTCAINYCATCSPDDDSEHEVPHKCTHCRSILQPLGGAHNAPPFWQRLTDFLRYPLSPIGIGLLLIAFVIPLVLPAGMPVHLARLVFLAGITVYLWAVFEQVATGNMQPLSPQDFIKFRHHELAVRLGAVLALLVALVAYVALMHSEFYGVLLTIVLLGLLPALLMGVGVSHMIGSAFSKSGLGAVLTGVGPIYVVLFLLPLGLLAALQSFVSLFADILPLAVGQALAMVAYTYLAITVFALSAYALFQFQEPLGYTPEGKLGAKRKAYKKVDPVQIQLEMLLKEGSYGKAVSLLRADVEKKTATIAQHDRYHKLLWAMKSEEALLAHAMPYLKALLQGRAVQAAIIFRDYTQRYPEFRLPDPVLRHDLALAFEELGDFKLAVHILNGLHKDYPHYPALPDAYLLAARLLNEKLGMPRKSLALVQFLYGRYRNHRSFADISAMQEALNQQLSPPQ